jgi:hypothetical protein
MALFPFAAAFSWAAESASWVLTVIFSGLIMKNLLACEGVTFLKSLCHEEKLGTGRKKVKVVGELPYGDSSHD